MPRGGLLHGMLDSPPALYAATLVSTTYVRVLVMPRSELLRLGPESLNILRQYAHMREAWRAHMMATRTALSSDAAEPAHGGHTPLRGASLAAYLGAGEGAGKGGKSPQQPPAEERTDGPGAAARYLAAARKVPMRERLERAIVDSGAVPKGLWKKKRPPFTAMGGSVDEITRRQAAGSFPGRCSGRCPVHLLPSTSQRLITTASSGEKASNIHCQKPASSLPAACQRPASGLPAACQRPAGGLPAACQRPASGLPAACQRPASGLHSGRAKCLERL